MGTNKGYEMTQPFDFLKDCFDSLRTAERMQREAKTEEAQNIGRAFEASVCVLIRKYLSTLNDKAGF
jgi:hypothetical protein